MQSDCGRLTAMIAELPKGTAKDQARTAWAACATQLASVATAAAATAQNNRGDADRMRNDAASQGTHGRISGLRSRNSHRKSDLVDTQQPDSGISADLGERAQAPVTSRPEAAATDAIPSPAPSPNSVMASAPVKGQPAAQAAIRGDSAATGASTTAAGVADNERTGGSAAEVQVTAAIGGGGQELRAAALKALIDNVIAQRAAGNQENCNEPPPAHLMYHSVCDALRMKESSSRSGCIGANLLRCTGQKNTVARIP